MGLKAGRVPTRTAQNNLPAPDNQRTRWKLSAASTTAISFDTPWKEKLPEQEFYVLREVVRGQFRLFQQWVADKVLPAIAGGVSGKEFAEELALRAGRGGRLNYEAFVGLGQDGLTACLNSWLQLEEQSQLVPEQVQQFVRELFSRAATQDRRSKASFRLKKI